MSTGNPFVDAVLERKTGYLGPFLAGALVQCLQMGIILDQATRYFFVWDSPATSNPNPRIAEKALVAFVISIASFQTIVAIWDMFAVHVYNFGNLGFALDFGWPDKMQPIVTMSMAAPVQAYLIWRVVKALNRRWWAIIPLFALQLVSIITSIITTVQAFQINFAAPAAGAKLPPPPPPGTPLPIDPTYVTYLASSAALDAATTTMLAIFLLRSRMKSSSDYTRDLIRRLVFVVWQAALPPAICALAGVFVYIATIRATAHVEVFGVRPGFWDLFFQLVLGKFYVISLLATVNSRAEILRSVNMHGVITAEDLSLTGRSVRGRRQPQPLAINVNVTSVCDAYKSPATVRSPQTGLESAPAYELKGMKEMRESDSAASGVYGQAV